MTPPFPTEPLSYEGRTVTVHAVWHAMGAVEDREPIARQRVSIMAREPIVIPPGARCTLGGRVVVMGLTQPPPAGLGAEWLAEASYWELAASHGVRVGRPSRHLDQSTGHIVTESSDVWSGWGAWVASDAGPVERGRDDWQELGSLYLPLDSGVRVGDLAEVDGETMRIISRRRLVYPVATEWAVASESGGAGGN